MRETDRIVHATPTAMLLRVEARAASFVVAMVVAACLLVVAAVYVHPLFLVLEAPIAALLALDLLVMCKATSELDRRRRR